MIDDLSPGFADPVADAQICFRAVLGAMSSPGSVHRVGGVVSPAPLCNAAGAIVLTLADHETPLCLDPGLRTAQGWITFHTGAPLVPDHDAMFVLAHSLPELSDLPCGSDEMPEASATVILQVSSVTTGQNFVLAGPGLRQARIVAIDGLPAGFVTFWQRNHALYPRGIDLILCAGDHLVALPRTVHIQEG